jgi:hypothetical protein
MKDPRADEFEYITYAKIAGSEATVMSYPPSKVPLGIFFSQISTLVTEPTITVWDAGANSSVNAPAETVQLRRIPITNDMVRCEIICLPPK